MSIASRIDSLSNVQRAFVLAGAVLGYIYIPHLPIFDQPNPFTNAGFWQISHRMGDGIFNFFLPIKSYGDPNKDFGNIIYVLFDLAKMLVLTPVVFVITIIADIGLAIVLGVLHIVFMLCQEIKAEAIFFGGVGGYAVEWFIFACLIPFVWWIGMLPVEVYVQWKGRRLGEAIFMERLKRSNMRPEQIQIIRRHLKV